MRLSPLTLAHGVIAASWAAILLYWLASAAGAAPHADRAKARRDLIGRIALGLLLSLAISLSLRIPELRTWQRAVFANTPLAVAGAAITAAGAVLAIAARRAIGRNWGMPGSQKMGTELVTSGPYAYVRHPIYTAILTMAIGSTIGVTPVWALGCVIGAGYFVWNARREEALMLQRFPDTYPPYRARTAMLVPFLL